EPIRRHRRTSSRTRPGAAEADHTLRSGTSARTPRSSTAPSGVFVIPINTDSMLLESFRRRDADAVRTMYRRYGNLVYSVAHRALGRHDLAEEASQQTFIRAWQAADRIDVDRDPAPWLATIAKRAAIDIYRREARRSASALSDVASDDPSVITLPPDV